MAFKMKKSPFNKNWWEKWGKKFAKRAGWQDKHINPPSKLKK